MQLDASKCGLRFMDVYVAQPYPHELKLTIEATSEQDDDILSDLLIDLCEIPVTIKARMVDGGLVCTTDDIALARSEEHTSELQSLMRNSYAVFCLKKTTHQKYNHHYITMPHTITQDKYNK